MDLKSFIKNTDLGDVLCFQEVVRLEQVLHGDAELEQVVGYFFRPVVGRGVGSSRERARLCF